MHLGRSLETQYYIVHRLLLFSKLFMYGYLNVFGLIQYILITACCFVFTLQSVNLAYYFLKSIPETIFA